MKIGLLYEPAYWFLLEDLVRGLEHEIRLIGGQSYRLTTDNAQSDGSRSGLCATLRRTGYVETT